MAEPDTTRGYNMGPGSMGANLNIQTEAAQKAVSDMAAAMKSLQTALQDFGNNAYMMAEKINRHLKSIGDTAAQVTQQISGVSAAVGGVPGSSAGGSGSPVFSSGSKVGQAAAWATNAVSRATANIDRVINKELTPGLPLGTFVGATGTEGAAGLTKDLALAPLRYLRNRINTNRDTAIMGSGALNMLGVQQGVGTDRLMSEVARFPGSIYGTRNDMLGLYADTGRLGASYNFGGQAGGQGVRAAGFFKGVQQMQMLNPLAPVGGEGGLVSQLGAYAGDTGAQQRSMMLTGGAMGMIAMGGRQKSLSEWAESILRWFEGLRPGANRGKPFKYGDLMAQYFPGSNIDAWFQINGVPQNMRDYWWTYALGKTSKGADTQDKRFEIGTDENNVAWQRLRAGTELTRTEFSLAGKMGAQYAQRESSNRWFNSLMGQLQETIIPAISNSIFAMIQFLPDSVEDLLMTGVERGATAITGGAGDIGDSGGYGSVGGTGLAGLHPDMKKKVGAMMRANPNLRMTSGLRDTGLQKRLRDKGNLNVSGKPSAHTRGMAADLGPSSQYGWIAKNAKRFGLASGQRHGEPWHVGMQGDISGVGDMFDDFLDSVKGVASSPEGMAGFITKILSTLTGSLGKLLGSGTERATPFAEGPEDLYRRLADVSKNVVLGFPVGGGGGAGGGGGGGRGFSDYDPLGFNPHRYEGETPDIAGGLGITGPGSREAGINAARALFNAGFQKRKDLETITAISWRESKWNPSSKNPSTSDRGLMQINMSAHKATMKAMGYSEADLMDIQKNANIAYRLWSEGGADYGAFQQLWGFSESSPYLSGAPGWDKNGNPLGRTSGADAAGIVRDSGLPVIGDVEAMQMGLNYSPRGGGGGVVFNNQFMLSVPAYGGGSNGGIDVRRTVTLIADHLEDEMKRRLVRTA